MKQLGVAGKEHNALFSRAAECSKAAALLRDMNVGGVMPYFHIRRMILYVGYDRLFYQTIPLLLVLAVG